MPSSRAARPNRNVPSGAALQPVPAGFPAWTWSLQKVRNTVDFGGALLGLAISVLG